MLTTRATREAAAAVLIVCALLACGSASAQLFSWPSPTQKVKAARGPLLVKQGSRKKVARPSAPAHRATERKHAPAVSEPLEETVRFQQRAQQPLPGPPAPTSSPQPAVRNEPPAALKMLPTAPEQIGQVPNHFVWIRRGLQAVQDPVDGQMVFIDDEGRIAGRVQLPSGFVIDDIFPDVNQIRLIDGGRRQISIPRSIDPVSATSLQDVPTEATSRETRGPRITRRGPQEFLYLDERRGGRRGLEIRSVAGGTLAQAYEIGPSNAGNRYIVTEEIVGAKPAIKVRVFVQRFDAAGNLSGVAYVPLDGMDSVPRDFITVTSDGDVRVLVPTSSGVKIRHIELLAAPAKGRKLGDSDLRELTRVRRELSVNTAIERRADVGGFRAPGDVRFKVDVPTPPISREQVVQNAMAYLSINWVMANENFSRAGIDNSCRPGEAKFWRRPTRFSSASIGQVIGPMPYRWGGDDTPESFKTRLEWGALAGSICTCRNPALDYCLSPESVGVDCSGLVSRAWGIEKRGTSGLLDVSDTLGSLDEVKPGDAFDWPGRHIRLLVRSTQEPTISYTVIESSTRLECEGVCERTYRPSELDAYRIIRYRGITD